MPGRVTSNEDMVAALVFISTSQINHFNYICTDSMVRVSQKLFKHFFVMGGDIIITSFYLGVSKLQSYF